MAVLPPAHALVPATQDGHMPSPCREIPRELFHDGGFPGPPDGQVADADYRTPHLMLAQEMSTEEVQAQCDDPAIQKRKRQKQSSQ